MIAALDDHSHYLTQLVNSASPTIPEYEDFATYTEIDPHNHIIVEENSITFHDLGGEKAFVYADKGEDFFSGDFVHLLTIEMSHEWEPYNGSNFWVLANSVGSGDELWFSGEHFYELQGYNDPSGRGFMLTLFEKRYPDANRIDFYPLTPDIPYYIKIQRRESEGVNGRLYLYVYSDEARTNLLFSNYINLWEDSYEKLKFRYIYPLQITNQANPWRSKGCEWNLSLGVQSGDTTPPTVSSVSPETGVSDVPIDTVITAAFSEAIDSSTINTNSFTLAGSEISGTVTYDPATYTATFTPSAPLDYNHTYTATLSTAISDAAGNPLAEPYTWSFTTESAEWSFAIITDLHIGHGYPDYDGTGPYYDDEENWKDSLEEGQGYYLTERLGRIVNWINVHKDNGEYGSVIKFVVVLGDISDSAEESELLKAREILSELDIPYIPLIGNHDVWPYTQGPAEGEEFYADAKTASWFPEEEADSACGDAYFEDIFWKTNGKNVDRIKSLFKGSWIRQEELSQYTGSPYLQNYVFSYREIRFLALDCVTRDSVKGPPAGVGPDAQLFDGTLQWLAENLPNGEPVIILSHHPFVVDSIAAFSPWEMAKVYDTFQLSGADILANFAGHTHDNDEVQRPWTPRGRLNTNVITTEAVLEEAKDVIRIVKVSGGELEDYDTTVGVSDPDNLVPISYFTYTPEIPAIGELVTFGASPYDPDGSITRYEWNFGDGSTASGGIVTHAYSLAGDYNVTLVVTDDGGSTSSASRVITVEGPNLVVTDIWESGWRIYYTIKNNGNAAVGRSLSSLMVDGDYKAWDLAGPLGPGESRTEYFLYKLPRGTHEVRVCADFRGLVSETDETDNCRTETLTR